MNQEIQKRVNYEYGIEDIFSRLNWYFSNKFGFYLESIQQFI